MARRTRRAATRPQGPPLTEYERLLAGIMAKDSPARKTIHVNVHKHFLLKTICFGMDITMTEATDLAVTDFSLEEPRRTL